MRSVCKWLWPALLVMEACSVLCQPDLEFAVFSDCQPGDAPFSPVMQAFARDMAAVRPSFVVGCGDYINGSSSETRVRQQWQGFFTAMAPLREAGIRLAPAPGNHDILGSRRNLAIFEEYFGNSYRSFNAGPYHFIVLNSEVPGQAGRIAGEQVAWLKSDLARHRQATLTFVALHRPLFPVGVHIGESMDEHPRDRDALHALFAAEGVDVVFSGHEHLFSRHQRDGVDYVITGGAGGPLYARAARGGFHHYVLARLYGKDCRLALRKLGGTG